MLKKLEISVFLPQKVLTQPKNVVTIAGFASKKAELSTQTKALRVVRSVDDGSKTDLGVSGNQTSSHWPKVLIFGGAQDASWEILK
jgi:predicted carbohydrate-binding protein with CBM5 and CBM33 domain